MMEWGDHSLKSGEDVLKALREDRDTAFDMHAVMEPVHRARFTGLLADALDLLLIQEAEARAAFHEASAALRKSMKCRGCGAAKCADCRALDDAFQKLGKRLGVP